MKSYKMEVSTKQVIEGVSQYVKQGDIEIYYPLLSEMGITIEPDSYDDEGFPVYKDSKVQYVFDSVLSSVKAQARNRLVAKSATLKPGLSIATTVEELLESGGNKGDAMAANREMLVAFKAWLPTTGKSEKVQLAVFDLAKNRAGLSLQDNDKKAKFQKYLVDFLATLKPEQVARFERSLEALNTACTEGDALDDM